MSYDGPGTPISGGAEGGKPPRLLQEVRNRLRLKHYSFRTEQAYLYWIRRYIRACGLRHPRELGGVEVEGFLTHLAVNDRVAPSTQNQALSALLFLYRDVLAIDLPWMENVTRAKGSRRLPVVLTVSEVATLLGQMSGRSWLMASLLYGSGLRLMECLRLRIKDVHLERCELTVRHGKGGKDRKTMLPVRLREPIRRQIEDVQLFHARDLAQGFGEVSLPYALARKYPDAVTEPGWQYVFPRSTARDRSVGRS